MSSRVEALAPMCVENTSYSAGAGNKSTEETRAIEKGFLAKGAISWPLRREERTQLTPGEGRPRGQASSTGGNAGASMNRLCPQVGNTGMPGTEAASRATKK